MSRRTADKTACIKVISTVSFTISLPTSIFFRSALSDEKRRLESRISEIEEELEEERAQNEMLMEKAKRAQLAVNELFL